MQLGNYLFSNSKVSGTIACETGSLCVHVFGLQPVCAINFSRDQSSDKLINFLDSRLEIIEKMQWNLQDKVDLKHLLKERNHCCQWLMK